MNENFPIETFWAQRIGSDTRVDLKSQDGWQVISGGLPGFIEPNLRKNKTTYGEEDPNTANVILVSAPGAVGKSTLAREISVKTGAVLIDLSKTGTVGANFITGGLAKTGCLQAFESGKVAVVIDGLDEARTRVNSENYADFLKDVFDIIGENTRPIVLLGRTGSIEETWLYLSEFGVRPAVLEIEYLNDEKALRFVRVLLQQLREEDYKKDPKVNPNPASTAGGDDRAARLMIDGVGHATNADGGNFIGYAPVLQAIAQQIRSYKNPQELVAELEGKQIPITLDKIVETVLTREQSKLEALARNFEDQSLVNKLYEPKEQIERLISRLYATPISITLPTMEPRDRETYEQALDTWVAEHPFLDGAGTTTSSEVFGGYLAKEALRNKTTLKAARAQLLRQTSKINPFLSAFYLPSDWSQCDTQKLSNDISLADIPLVFTSLAARIPTTDEVFLEIVEIEDNGTVDGGRLEAEIEIVWKSVNFKLDKTLTFTLYAEGSIPFGNRVHNLRVEGDRLDVELGTGRELVMVAPVDLDVGDLSIEAEKLVVEPSGKSSAGPDRSQNIVTMRSARYVGSLTARPVLRGQSSLSVYWPDSQHYPWDQYSAEPPEPLPLEFGEAFQRLTKMLTAFRADRYGNLGKYKPFVEHRRRTKGSGQKVLNHLLSEGVITDGGHVYILHPDVLLERTGLNYQMMRERRWNAKSEQFLREALRRN